MLQAGTVVAQHLRLVRQLGSGGMGSVWVAEHLRLGGQVAVKFLSTALLDHEGARSRFAREAKWAAKIRSPHVVQVHDHGVMSADNPVPYIVMELMDGQDLAALLEHEGPLGLARTTEILEQVCEALSKAHEVGVVHRDIKPENIFVLNQTKTFVKLLDFGVAHGDDGQIDRLTQTGLLLGTAYYMSPEQLFSGKDIDHRADLWALGVLVYQMLTNSLPFQAETFGQLCLKVRDGTFPALNEVVNVPPTIEQWFARALRTDREERFQSALEMYDAFVQAVAGVAPQLGPELPTQPSHAGSGTVRVSSEQLAEQRKHWTQRQQSGNKPQPPHSGTDDLSGFSTAGSAELSRERVATESKAALSVNTDDSTRIVREPTSFLWPAALVVGLLGAVGVLVMLYSSRSVPAESSAAGAPSVEEPASLQEPAQVAASAAFEPAANAQVPEQNGALHVAREHTSTDFLLPTANSASVEPKKQVVPKTAAVPTPQSAAVVRAAPVKPSAVHSPSKQPTNAPRETPSPSKTKYRGF